MIDARFRPLDPSAWPQALTKGRRSPQFRSPLSATLDLLETELEAIKARDIVIETAHAQRDIRNDGWPRADARVPSFPGVILSFDSVHGPLRYLTDTFEAGSYYVSGKGSVRIQGWEANLRAIALSLEALRAVDRYGVSKRGEQYRGWGALPPGTPMGPAMTVEAACRLLGLGMTPMPEGVKVAFRRLAKEAHPDAGGDPDDYRRLVEARDLLLREVS